MAQQCKNTMVEREPGDYQVPFFQQYSGSYDEIFVFYAKYRKTTDALEIIYTNTVVIDRTDSDGLTALHYACVNNDKELVVSLLQFGADIEIRDMGGWTTTHHIAQNGRVEILVLLSNNRNQYLAVDNIGRTPVFSPSS